MFVLKAKCNIWRAPAAKSPANNSDRSFYFYLIFWNCAKSFKIHLITSFKKCTINSWVILSLHEITCCLNFPRFWQLSWNIHYLKKKQWNASKNLPNFNPSLFHTPTFIRPVVDVLKQFLVQEVIQFFSFHFRKGNAENSVFCFQFQCQKSIENLNAQRQISDILQGVSSLGVQFTRKMLT